MSRLDNKNGYISMFRNEFDLLKDHTLTQSEFIIYQFYVSISDWDPSHANFGKFRASDTEVGDQLGENRTTIFRIKKNLIKKGFLTALPGGYFTAKNCLKKFGKEKLENMVNVAEMQQISHESVYLDNLEKNEEKELNDDKREKVLQKCNNTVANLQQNTHESVSFSVFNNNNIVTSNNSNLSNMDSSSIPETVTPNSEKNTDTENSKTSLPETVTSKIKDQELFDLLTENPTSTPLVEKDPPPF